MEVVFTRLAERQIDELHAYLELKASQTIADTFVSRVVNYCLALELFPQRGTNRNDILPGLRTVGLDRRVTIAFMIHADRVVIEGIFYGGQDYARRLRRAADLPHA